MPKFDLINRKENFETWANIGFYIGFSLKHQLFTFHSKKHYFIVVIH